MTLQHATQPRQAGSDAQAHGPRNQCAAFCYRIVKQHPQLLLISSRETGRWILPKGWPMSDKTAAESAAREAWEEAGVEGKLRDLVLGLYAYDKLLPHNQAVPCIVAVYPLKVKKLHADFPERRERRRKWFDLKKAASRVHEPELSQIIAHFELAKLPV